MIRVTILLLSFLAIGCTGNRSDHLTVYSGRSKSLVEPLVQKYREQTGTTVDVRYGDTAQLAVALTEEGRRTPADLFWAQDAGALGAVAAAGMLDTLPDSLLDRVPPGFRGSGDRWVATSGRARTIAYSTERVAPDEIPHSVFDLVRPEYRNRVGWAPANGSFQSFVTAMRVLVGEERTRTWLEGMKENGARSYPKNTAILQGIANGEVDFGLPNHYYLYRFKSQDPAFPVDQTAFDPGDAGNLINVAGIGVILREQGSSGSAPDFIAFLLGQEAQEYFARETFEYRVIRGGGRAPRDSVRPSISLDELRDLERTLEVLRDTGLL